MNTFRVSRSPLFWVAAAFGLLILLAFLVPDRLVEWLWMSSVGYASIFWTLLWTKVGLFFGMLAVALLYFGGNAYALQRQLPIVTMEGGELGVAKVGDVVLTKRRLRSVSIGVSVVFGLLFASSFAARWDDVIRFLHAQPYGDVDPIFGHDLSFYLLRLPFIEALQGAIVGLTFLGVFFLVSAYLMTQRIYLERGRLQIAPSALRHLGVNLALFLGAWSWGYYLDRYELLYTPGGVVFGASYIDAAIRIPMLSVMAVATLLLIGLVIYILFVPRFRWLLYGGGAYVLLLAIGLGVVPSVVQQFTVEPNELEAETPYIEHNIELTRAAYQLDQVEERPYPVREDLSFQQIAGNEQTLRNIRLWDPRLLIQTYRQIQEIRLYYQFYNVDVDRYDIDGEYRQVMVSARELAQQLPERANTWVNRNLQYTHGYGLTMNLAAQEGAEGTPSLLIKDLPPVSVEGLEVDEAAIYYGERTPSYRIVNSGVQELDYPRGDENVYTSYQGEGGVLLSSAWKELLFAWYLSDFNVLLSDYIQPESRIQFWNRVQERIRHVAPFLQLDQDPYLVLSEGRLYWIQDAYTTARTFPYAEPVQRRGVNYIRNSVKIVVDAYHGSVDFYVMDPDDPVLGAYRSAFPGTFKPLGDLSDDLKSHLRYPEDLFDIQVGKFNRYHMTIPQVFYNNEDLWTRPRELYGSSQTIMEPYYLLTRLPEQEHLQFLLMTPVTPNSRDNMIGWMAAKSDFPDYGNLVVYKLPKEKLVFGPNQIESKIEQDTEISRQLSLWDQRGSRVIRGNLIVVPIEQAFLYVEPVYLIAEGLEIPQLKRVIVTFGERIAMEMTLNDALQAVFGAALADERPAAQPSPAVGGTPQELQRARDVFRRARQALQEGDFATFGTAFDQLREVLDTEEEETEPQGDPSTSGGTP